MKAILLALILFMTLLNNLNAQIFKVVLADYKPYSWYDDKTNSVRGIEIDILKEIIENRLNIPLSIEILPWKRAQMYVKQGEADAFIAVPTEQRLSYTMINQEPIINWGVSFFINHTQKLKYMEYKINTIDDIKQLKVASMIGNGWVEKNLKGFDIQWVVKMEQMLSLLHKNRVDLIVDCPTVMDYHIKDAQLQNEIIELKKLFSVPMHLGVSKKSDFLFVIPSFDKALKAMKEDGTLEKIIRTYK